MKDYEMKSVKDIVIGDKLLTQYYDANGLLVEEDWEIVDRYTKQYGNGERVTFVFSNNSEYSYSASKSLAVLV